MPAFTEVYKLKERPDVIFFLTDGIIPGETATDVRDLNSKGRAVVINTISFGTDAARKPLQEIAADSDGVYRHINAVGMSAP